MILMKIVFYKLLLYATNAYNYFCEVDEYVDSTNVWNNWKQLRQGEQEQGGYVKWADF